MRQYRETVGSSLFRPIGRVAVFGVLVFLAAAGYAPAAEPLVKTGAKIAFLGDSITAGGWNQDGGYVRLVMDGLARHGVAATAIPAGVGGHKSNDMLARLQRDVLDKSPDWMTLSCGVNDVWHGARRGAGRLQEEYRGNRRPGGARGRQGNDPHQHAYR